MAKKKPAFPSRPCPKCGEPIHIKSKMHEACGWRAEDAAAVNEADSENGEKTGGYFRRIFKENPKLLKGRSNEEVLQRWLADHPGHPEVPKNIKAHLSNVKSTMRSKKRKRGKSRDDQMPVTQVSEGSQLATLPAQASSGHDLEALEVQIDECITMARQVDREGLQEVIDHLRRARNKVVWKIGM